MPTVDAYVNHGRWVASCVCLGAELAFGELMVCASCGVASRIEWPDNRDEIETVLSKRPDALTRNWWPHETVEMLKAENAERGI